MKKLLAILTVLVFFVAISAPVYAASENKNVIVNVDEEKPKKAEKSKEEKKSSDCQSTAKKSGCESKKSKSCGDKGKN